MPRPFVLAHISDLHASPFGDSFHDGARLVRRSAAPVAVGADAELAWEEAGWRVYRGPRGAVKLLDREGYAHSIPTVKGAGGIVDAVERAAWKACRLEARSARTLARDLPTPPALARLLAATPTNANLRLVAAARALDPATTDAVLVTGDVTDDGDGYELVLAAFRPFIARGAFFVVPGNHDRYLFPVASSGRPRPDAAEKARRYTAFATAAGTPPGPSGAWFRTLAPAEGPTGGVVLLGLDSCAGGQPRFFRHNGAIGAAQLAALAEVAATEAWRGARHRLVALHHHVVPLGHGVGRRAPVEFGMRLDDAAAVARAFDAAGVTLVLHGHRHVSEERQPAGCRFRLLASPSFTLGCRSGAGPSYWRVAFDPHVRAERRLLDGDVLAPVPASVPADRPSGELPLDDDPESSRARRPGLFGGAGAALEALWQRRLGRK